MMHADAVQFATPLALGVVPSVTLVALSWMALIAAAACACVLLVDILAGRRQPMAIMNVVWPLTALYAGPLALVAYFYVGRSKPMDRGAHDQHHQHVASMKSKRPMWQAALLGTTHCGAGCMLGDMLSDGGLFLLGASALLGSALLTSYVFDFIAAYLLGIVFQYFAIVPMRHLSRGAGIWAAIKADTLSLIAFQVGMYAWMAIFQQLLFRPRLEANSPVFWFMMQIGMLAGLITSFPMNWFLIRAGIKEKM
jgi:hypothetical protein